MHHALLVRRLRGCLVYLETADEWSGKLKKMAASLILHWLLCLIVDEVKKYVGVNRLSHLN